MSKTSGHLDMELYYEPCAAENGTLREINATMILNSIKLREYRYALASFQACDSFCIRAFSSALNGRCFRQNNTQMKRPIESAFQMVHGTHQLTSDPPATTPR